MSEADDLARRRRRVVRMTLLSLACYAGFLATSAMAALQRLPVEHTVTMSSLVLIAAALLLLPRRYLPTSVAARPSPEEGQHIDALARLQRTGLYLRLGYLAGAIVTILALPTLVQQE